MILLISFLSGCGNLNSIHHFLTVDEGTGALVDIKQRAIIVSKRKIPITSDANYFSQQTQTIVCAEPSPDALSAYAAELAAEGGVPGQIAVKLAGATQESAAFVGLRTQSIQLLRDSLYRLCEGYMSGALDEYQYDTLMRRYQRYMIALLGIEQLTGAMRAPSVTIQTQGKAEAATSIADMRKNIEKIDEEIQEKTKSKDDLLTKQKNESDSTKQQTIQREIDAVVKAIEEKKSDKEDLEKAIKEERNGLVAEGSTTASVSGVGLPTQRSDAHIQQVTDAVKEIVLETLRTDEIGQLCWGYLVYPPKGITPDTSITQSCKDHIAKGASQADGGTINLHALQKAISTFSKFDSFSPDTKAFFEKFIQKADLSKKSEIVVSEAQSQLPENSMYAFDKKNPGNDAPPLEVKWGTEIVTQLYQPNQLSELKSSLTTLAQKFKFNVVALCSEGSNLFDKQTHCSDWTEIGSISNEQFSKWLGETKKNRTIYLSIGGRL